MRTNLIASLGLASSLLASAAMAQVIPLNNFARIGTTTDATASALSASGGTISYITGLVAGNDAGIQANLGSSYTFTTVGQSLTYSFTMGSIVNSLNSNNVFRSGFDFGTTGNVHFVSGVGTSTDARSFAQNNGNPFSQGTQAGTTLTTFLSPAATLRFAAGNTVNATLTLTYNGPGTGSFHNYNLTAVYSDGTNSSNPFSVAITDLVGSNVVTGVYHLTNTGTIEVAGNTWTISNAQLSVVPEPSTYALLAGALALGVVWFRRRS